MRKLILLALVGMLVFSLVGCKKAPEYTEDDIDAFASLASSMQAIDSELKTGIVLGDYEEQVKKLADDIHQFKNSAAAARLGGSAILIPLEQQLSTHRSAIQAWNSDLDNELADYNKDYDEYMKDYSGNAPDRDDYKGIYETKQDEWANLLDLSYLSDWIAEMRDALK